MPLMISSKIYADSNISQSKDSLHRIRPQTLEQRVETLEGELDAAISASTHTCTEKRQAEAAKRAAELYAHEVTRELENTTRVHDPPRWGPLQSKEAMKMGVEVYHQLKYQNGLVMLFLD